MKIDPISKKETIRKRGVAVVIFLGLLGVYWFLLGGNYLTYMLHTCAGADCGQSYAEAFSFGGKLILGILFAGFGLLVLWLVAGAYNCLRKKSGKKILILSIFIILFVAAGCIFFFHNTVPTAFASPAPDTTPYHIAGATIKTIVLPGAIDPESEKVDSIQSLAGVDDLVIVGINDRLTQGLFTQDGASPVDIRNPKNRLAINPKAHVDSVNTEIQYADNGVIGYRASYDIYYDGDTHDVRRGEEHGIFQITKNGKGLIEAPVLFENSDAVLSHFYPNGKELLNGLIHDELFDNGRENDCYTADDFPSDFFPEFRPNTGEVVFQKSFTDAMTPCEGSLEIAIPVDRLGEVVQYVPSDSVLRLFMK